MAVELLEAIARFRADTSDVRTQLAAVETEAKQTATRVEQQLARGPAGAEAQGRRAGQAARQLRQGFAEATGAVKELGFDIAQSLDPALASLVRDLAGAGRAATQMGLAFSGVAALAAALAAGIEVLARRAEEAERFQVALNQALKSQDAGRLAATLGDLAEHLETVAVRTATAQQEIRGLEDATQVIFAFWRSAFGPSLTTIEQRAKEAGEAFAQLFTAIEGPTRTLRAQKDLLEVLRQQLATEQKGATTQALVNQLGDERIRQLNTQQAVILGQIQLERQRQLNAVPQALQGEVRSRVVAQINQEFDLRIETEHRRFDEERRVVVDENRRLTAARQAQQFEDLAKDIDAQRARVEARTSAARQLLELEKTLGGSLAELHAEERARTEEDLRVQATALEEQTSLRTAAFRARLAAASADERPQIEREFTDFLRGQETARLELRQRAAVELAQLEQTQAEERIRRAQETTAHLATFGQATLSDQRRLLEQIVRDESVSLATRRKAAEDLQARQLQLEQQRMEILRSLGIETTQEEIRRQEAIVSATQAGSQKQIDAIQQVVRLRRQAIDEARQQAQSLLGLGDADEEVTLFDVQREATERQREASLAINRALAGQVFRRAELSQALGDLDTLNQLRPTGFDLRGLLGRATEPCSRRSSRDRPPRRLRPSASSTRLRSSLSASPCAG